MQIKPEGHTAGHVAPVQRDTGSPERWAGWQTGRVISV